MFAAISTLHQWLFMSVIAYSALRQYIIHYALRVLQTLFTNKDTHMMHNCGTDYLDEGLEKIVYPRILQLSHNILIKETKMLIMLIYINVRSANFPLKLGVYCSRNSFKIKPK